MNLWATMEVTDCFHRRTQDGRADEAAERSQKTPGGGGR